MPADQDKKDLLEQRLTYVAFSGIFLAIFAIFNLFHNKKNKDFNLRPFDFVLLGLSTFRLGRLVAFEHVMEPYRAPFTETVPDQTGAGENVEPKGTGWRRAVGELISCPICMGTWIAAGLVYALQIMPRPTRVFMTIMGTIGLGELFHRLTEALCWIGSAARKQAGS